MAEICQQNLSRYYKCLQGLCTGTHGERALAPLEGAGAHTMLRCIPVHPAPELLLLGGDRTGTCMSLSAGSYTKGVSLRVKNRHLVLSHL